MDVERSQARDAAPVFDRTVDGYGHRPRWTTAEVEAHRALLYAESKGVTLSGRGDDRRADFLNKEIGRAHV